MSPIAAEQAVDLIQRRSYDRNDTKSARKVLKSSSRVRHSPARTFVRLPIFLGFGAGIAMRRNSHLSFSKNPRRETATC
jgi:hypothetical protein